MLATPSFNLNIDIHYTYQSKTHVSNWISFLYASADCKYSETLWKYESSIWWVYRRHTTYSRNIIAIVEERRCYISNSMLSRSWHNVSYIALRGIGSPPPPFLNTADRKYQEMYENTNLWNDKSLLAKRQSEFPIMVNNVPLTIKCFTLVPFVSMLFCCVVCQDCFWSHLIQFS